MIDDDLGSQLARLEMRVAFEEILQRIPAFTVDDDFRPKAFGRTDPKHRQPDLQDRPALNYTHFRRMR